jgi:hypothetical protein
MSRLSASFSGKKMGHSVYDGKQAAIVDPQPRIPLGTLIAAWRLRRAAVAEGLVCMQAFLPVRSVAIE